MNKRQIKKMRRQFTLKERFRYWFDNRMAKGSLGFIRTLIIASVLLAQIAENPELVGVFREILSNKGSELFLKNAEELQLTGRHSVAELRCRLLQHRCVFLGYMDEQKESRFNPPLREKLDIRPGDCFIVLSEE